MFKSITNRSKSVSFWMILTFTFSIHLTAMDNNALQIAAVSKATAKKPTWKQNSAKKLDITVWGIGISNRTGHPEMMKEMLRMDATVMMAEQIKGSGFTISKTFASQKCNAVLKGVMIVKTGKTKANKTYVILQCNYNSDFPNPVPYYTISKTIPLSTLADAKLRFAFYETILRYVFTNEIAQGKTIKGNILISALDLKAVTDFDAPIPVEITIIREK